MFWKDKGKIEGVRVEARAVLKDELRIEGGRES